MSIMPNTVNLSVTVSGHDSLLEWQTRTGMTGAAAARALGVPYLTYREYLPGGRRRKGGIFPRWLGLLCAYIEEYGPLKSTVIHPGEP